MKRIFNRLVSKIFGVAGSKGTLVAAALSLAPTAAFASHHDLRLDIDLRPPVVVYSPAPVIHERDRVWVDPVYQTVTGRQWIEPVYQTVVDRVWTPERVEVRDVVRHGRVVHRERVFVPGHYDDVPRQVLVSEGHWQLVERQELVTPGHWETRESDEPNYWPSRR